MRRTIRLMVTVALIVGIFNLAANAATIQCVGGGECTGTNNSDMIFERLGNDLDDNIFGLRGGDVILADDFTSDRDELYGGRANDRLNTNDNDGRDLINCGRGNNDVAILDGGDNVNHRNCEDIRRR
jgi:Ca2+-binding RTX toxin-like protein